MVSTKVGHYPIVQGIPWIRLHDVSVWFAFNMVTFGSQYWMTPRHDAPVTVQGVEEDPLEPVYAHGGILEPQIHRQWSFRGNMVMLHGSLFLQKVKKGKFERFKASLYDINKSIERNNLQEQRLEEIVPNRYHEFLPLFNEVSADHIPTHLPCIDHEVRQKEGETSTWGPLHSMSRTVLLAHEKWLEKDMVKGFICQSSSPFGAPVLLAKKQGGGLHVCIDYQDINSKTIRNGYPLPLIRETLNSLGKAKIYTRSGVRGACNQSRVKEEDEHKLAFQTGYRLWEPLVMQFGTTNAPADFQGYINHTISEEFDDFALDSSSKNIAVRAEWLRQSGCAPSELSETPGWQTTQRPAPIRCVVWHIALRSRFRRFFSLCRYPIVNGHCGVLANCDHTSGWVHWVHQQNVNWSGSHTQGSISTRHFVYHIWLCYSPKICYLIIWHALFKYLYRYTYGRSGQ